MKILITAPGQYLAESDEPEVGRSYYLEDATAGSSAQGRAFHALLQEYWKSGAFSYPAKSFDELKQHVKRALGAGFEAFIYVTMEGGQPIICDAKHYSEIPKGIPRHLARGRLKSFSDYSLKERRLTIDALIAEMDHNGVKSKKYFEILKGMEGVWK